VVVAQERHDLFRLGPLGKAGEAAHIAEHDDDLAAMAFEDALVAAREVISASCGARNRRNFPVRSISASCAATRSSNSRFQPATSSVRSRNSPRSRAFSIAMTACAAKFWSSAICLSVNGRISRR